MVSKGVVAGIASCACFMCGIIIMIALLPASIEDINQNEVGIEYNKDETRAVGNRVLTEGREYWSPSSRVIRFPRTVQTIENDLRCLSLDGLEMQLRVSVQYQIIANITELRGIIFEYGGADNLEDYLEALSRSFISHVCSQSTGEDFIDLRGDIQEEMQESLTRAFGISDAHSEIILVQLQNVEHPPRFIDANQRRQDVLQQQQEETNRRAQQITAAETRLAVAEQEAITTVITATGEANARLAVAEQEAIAAAALWNERSIALQSIATEFDTQSVDALIDFLRYRIISGQESPVIVVDN